MYLAEAVHITLIRDMGYYSIILIHLIICHNTTIPHYYKSTVHPKPQKHSLEL